MAEVEATGPEACAKVQLELEHRESGRRDVRHDKALNVRLRTFWFELGDNRFWLVYGVDGRFLVVLSFVIGGSGALPEEAVEVAERRWSLWRKQKAQ
ncbi:hypothetical protein QLQ12_12515 [Actinoplanes sp. NEAU-A12]|uniref:Addiction module toxin RelE n=1 Tax=Actinoplanes sandaracinus TaxID=3045177 RepID=A0ABT6WI56_9ACTN|nr:hypothetical protein [Actinoplanes sandaracinus]MDI6099417.1 hypothetical protein [Actinoplanes sandaracinus]